MKKSFCLSVPKPCHEKWEEFTPTSSGGFCASCQKEVIDFTTWDGYRIKQHFKNSSGSSCGRFKSNQLKTYVIESRPSYILSKWVPASLITAFVAFYSGASYGHTKEYCTIEQYDAMIQNNRVNKQDLTSEISIKGVVLSDEDNSSLPGVNVFIKGTSLGTLTNIDGEFEIFPKNSKGDETLVFSAIGFATEERKVANFTGKITLHLDVQVLGDYMLISPYSPRGIWWRIRGLFK